MRTEKNIFNLPDGTTEVIIREGNAPDLLPIKPPRRTVLDGVISAPYEFLLRRHNTGQFPIERCTIIVDRENVSIKLITNEDDEYTCGKVVGELTQHPKFREFGINSDRRWLANDFGQFCKMNRAYFTDRDTNMKLVALLKNYMGQINIKYEKERNENGSFKDNYSGLVSDNLPPTFSLKIPVFKGVPAVDLEIEFYATVNGKDIYLQLCSPSATQIFEEMRDSVINEQIALIREIAPNIVIIEK